MKTEILFEDGDVLVIYKPSGFAVQTSKVGEPDVVSELKNYLQQKVKTEKLTGGIPYLGIIHRLDQPVEGLLVLGKNKQATSFLSKQLQKEGGGGTFHKKYYAVLCGKPSSLEGTVEDFLYKNKDRAEIAKNGSVPGAKRAVLRYAVRQVREADGLYLADIEIQTGRFHQIRAQMAHGGTPLLGDFKYGNEETTALARKLGVQNVALCAYSLSFFHPISKREMCFHVKPKGRAFSFFSQE